MSHLLYNRLFRKVRKTRHQNREFGPKPGEIQKKTCKKRTLAFKLRNAALFLCPTEFHPVLTRLSFFLSGSTVATYIFTAPTCTTTMITSNLAQ